MRSQVKVSITTISKDKNHKVCTVVAGRTVMTKSGLAIVAVNEKPSAGDSAVLRESDLVKVTKLSDTSIYFIGADGYEYTNPINTSEKVLVFPEQIPESIQLQSVINGDSDDGFQSINVDVMCDWHHYNERFNKYSYHVSIVDGTAVINKIYGR